MKKFYKLLSLKIVLIIGLFFIMALKDWPEAYSLLVVYIPLLAFYVYRHKKGASMKDINRFFRIYTWFLITITMAIIGLLVFLDGDFYSFYGFAISFSEIGRVLLDTSSMFLVLLLLIGLLKINNQFIPLAERKKHNINKKLIIVVLAILIAGIFTWTTWDHAYNMEGRIYDIYGTGPENEQILIMQVNRYFEKAFREIIIFDSFIFISTFLLLYSWKKNDKGSNN